MKINNFKRLNKEDVQEEFRPLVDRIGDSLNSFNDDVYILSNKNITIQDNLFQEIKTLEVTTLASDSTIPNNTLQFKNNLRTPIKGLSLIYLENLTNLNVFPTTAVQCFFTEVNNIVTINRITGLTANNKYRIRLLTFGG